MTQFNNVEILKHTNLKNILQPGIFKIVCTKTGRAFFGEGNNVLAEMMNYQESMFEKNVSSEIFLQDYKNFGLDSFDFIIVSAGPDWKNEKKRQLKLKEVRDSWPGELY